MSAAPDRPVPRVDPCAAYQPPRPAAPGDLRLDGNEGAAPDTGSWLAALGAAGPELLRRYPQRGALERLIATRHAVADDQVLVTAGADDALDRCCRAYLGAGRELVLPVPGFDMLERFAVLSGGEVVRIDWPRDGFPVSAVLAACTARTGVIAVVSPNNPTGEAVDASTLAALAAARPQTLIVLDHAYVEYADTDLTSEALRWPNVVVVRTLSKAWGLAGCRVGYALGAPEVIAALRAAGGPYPVASTSLLAAVQRLSEGERAMRAHVAAVRAERGALEAWLRAAGIACRPSQANFVCLDLGPRAVFAEAALAAEGVRVRRPANLPGALRITIPDDAGDAARLRAALARVLTPQALLFDMDGVLADCEDSYRACVLATAADFGVALERNELLAATLAGGANDEWALTARLLAARGVSVSLEEVVARFQHHYLGDGGRPGLRERERTLVSPETLARLAARLPLGIVTGRPRAEAEWFLARSGFASAFRVLVTREDAALKPDAAPVRLALQRLGVERAWLVGDTVDDMRAACGAGVLAIGIAAPGEAPARVAPALAAAGAAWWLESIEDIEELL